MSEFSVQQLTEIIEKLPADTKVPFGAKGYNNYNTQKDHWLGWLDSKSTTGTYQRKDTSGRGAKYVYNHIMEPKMLLWLISASSINSELLEKVTKESNINNSMASSCATIRKIVSWQVLEKHLNN